MEKTRYNRQIILPEVGDIGQQKLLDAKVLIVGIGGLGTAVLPYLTAAGVGEIGVIDDDILELTNLQRQVIYKSSAVGKSKVLEAKQMALALNPLIKINSVSGDPILQKIMSDLTEFAPTNIGASRTTEGSVGERPNSGTLVKEFVL